VSSTPHPYREELFSRWSEFLNGDADRESTAEYIEMRIADYGPEELVHSGLLLLNDDLIAAREGEPSSRDRFDAWQGELVIFDKDPAHWNRNWAINYAAMVLPKLRSTNRAGFLNAMRDKLTDADVEEIAGLETDAQRPTDEAYS
jgi:hypothetical protein